MPKTKKTALKPHSMYEEALIYMSYRYAIGRSTIHSHCHACDLIKNEYERFKLNPGRMAFTSLDINRSIEDCLRFSNLNVYLRNCPQKNVHIFEEVIKASIDEKGILKYDDLEDIKQMNFNVEMDGNVVCDKIELYEDGEKPSHKTFVSHRLKDLLIWYQVAKVLDMSTHKWLTLIDGTTEEYVELYNDTIVDGKHAYKLYKVPVRRFVDNAAVLTYIPDESIKKLNP